MTTFARLLTPLAAAAIGVSAFSGPLLAQPSPDAAVPDRQRSTTGITAPSEERKLLFPNPGVIADAMVKEGDKVKSGEAVMKQDDREEVKRFEAAKIAADVERLKITAQEKDRDQKQVELARKKDLYSKKAVGLQELQEAELAVALSQANVEVAKGQAEQADAQAAVQQVRVDQMTLKSPIDGIVSQVGPGAGEFSNPQQADKPTITIVKNDPLWIEVRNLRTGEVARLKVGQSIPVRYAGETREAAAKVIFISPVADARSDTQAVRLEMPNPDGRSTGLKVDVLLGADATASAR